MPAGKLRVLIVEDNEADVLLIEESLQEHGVQCESQVASDGEKAFTFLKHAAGEAAAIPHLVLLDLNLGTHHGTEVLAHIRSTPALAHIPVVVLTSSDSPLDREKVRELGASLYLRKPMDLIQYLEIGRDIANVLADVA